MQDKTYVLDDSARVDAPCVACGQPMKGIKVGPVCIKTDDGVWFHAEPLQACATCRIAVGFIKAVAGIELYDLTEVPFASGAIHPTVAGGTQNIMQRPVDHIGGDYVGGNKTVNQTVGGDLINGDKRR